MKIYATGFDFLQCYCEPYAEFLPGPEGAEFVLAMNLAGSTAQDVMAEARAAADAEGIPFCWWSIEDPNALGGFLHQARLADYIFTSDAECIPTYRRRLGHDRIFWLPAAADCEVHHVPLPLADDAADFVFSGNWYDHQWEARRWGTETVILPLAEAGYSFEIFSYDEPPYEVLRPFWRGGTSCRTVAEQYRHGRVVLGNNNQRSHMDGRERTVMTSMRTFEALACGKPLLAPQSDAYVALGFNNGEHIAWAETPADALAWAESLLRRPEEAAAMAERGRAFVQGRHTYGHRLARLREVIG